MTSLRRGIEGDRVELGDAPSDRTHTLAWSEELTKDEEDGGGGEREHKLIDITTRKTVHTTCTIHIQCVHVHVH